MNKPFKAIIGLSLAGIGIMAGLFGWMSIRQNVHNGFVRNVKPGMISNVSVTNLDQEGYYFAGVSGGKIYFGNGRLPDHILSTDLKLSGKFLQLYKMPVPVRWSFVEVTVYDDRLFFSDRSLSLICSTTPGVNNIADVKRSPYSFTSLMPIGFKKYVMNVVDSVRQQYELAIYASSDDSLSIVPVLKKQNDGFFSVDGMLRRTNDLNRLVYIYYYRNDIQVLDSNLNRIADFHTIDTISTFSNTVGKIKSGQMLTLSEPPKFVNKLSCIYGKNLFIRSNIRADNESQHSFESNSVIDVYDIADGKYRFSFYIPNIEQKPVDSIGITDSLLVVTYKNRFASLFRIHF